MVGSGKRRILKRAAMALAVVMVLVAALKFLMPGGPSAIEQSSALRLGMTSAEVTAVMGVEKISIQQRPNEWTLLYGRPGETTFLFQFLISNWINLLEPMFNTHDWSVRVHLDAGGHVYRIERDDEVEEAVPQPSAPNQSGE